MDYIISKDFIKVQPGFQVLSSIKEIPVVNSTTNLIVIDFVDDDIDFMLEILRFVSKKNLSKIAYLNPQPKVIIREFLERVGAFVSTDPVDLTDNNQLSEIVIILDTFSPNDTEDVFKPFEVVDLYLTSVLEKETPNTRTMIKRSLIQLSNTLEKHLERNDLKKELVELVLSVDQKTEKDRNSIERLEKELQNRQQDTIGSGLVNAFQPTIYTGVRKVIVFKEYAPTDYLTSFVIALSHYFSNKELKSKVIIVDRDTPFTAERYRGITEVDFSTINKDKSTLSLTNLLWTSKPTTNIMDTLLDAIGYEIYLVIDRTYKQSSIVTGRSVTTLNAVSSRRLMRQLRLEPQKTLIGDKGDVGQLGTLSTIAQYPVHENQRIDHYCQVFEQSMNKIYKMME